jgi:GSH-dependent disulfide-bond oxidoreductase
MSSVNYELYTWPTPNGRKVSIMLEELGVSYQVIPIDITSGKQNEKAFKDISPNGKIPILKDLKENLYLMESGVILHYLAKKYDQFLPSDNKSYYEVMQWLFFQVGHVGPMLGQNHHFNFYNKDVSPYAEQRYIAETYRLYEVLDSRLSTRTYIAGDYSIADIATWPWVSRFPRQSVELERYPHVLRWYQSIAQRDAVQRGFKVLAENEVIP